jgi:arylformamidase
MQTGLAKEFKVGGMQQEMQQEEINALAARWRDTPREARDADFWPSRTAKDAPAMISWYQAATQEARAAHLPNSARLGVGYDPVSKAKLDIYLPKGARPQAGWPIHIFIHGGFWQELSIDYAGFAASAYSQAGVIYVALGYPLAPLATFTQIVAALIKGIDWVITNAANFGGDAAHIVVSGHSAGAGLAAILATPPYAQRYARHLRGLLLISGVFDLAPIQDSYLNAALNLSSHEVTQFSAYRFTPSLPQSVIEIAVGADEPQEFRRHSALLAAAWQGENLSYQEYLGRDHFDILLPMALTGGELWQKILSWVKVTP